MFGITDLSTYLLGTLFIVLLPGPNSLYVLSVAAQRDVRLGFQGACGIFVGDTILMVLSATGVASVRKACPAPHNIANPIHARSIAVSRFKKRW